MPDKSCRNDTNSQMKEVGKDEKDLLPSAFHHLNKENSNVLVKFAEAQVS